MAASAGTWQPMWASSTTRAVWRRYVDFPAMLGPVMICRVAIRQLGN